MKRQISFFRLVFQNRDNFHKTNERNTILTFIVRLGLKVTNIVIGKSFYHLDRLSGGKSGNKTSKIAKKNSHKITIELCLS